MPGINQVEVRHSIGLDFARIIPLDAASGAEHHPGRRDARPRDCIDGNPGFTLTGHLVFSTLHTNDAPSAVSRMVDIGVPGYMVASSVIAVLAQRLVRTICPPLQGSLSANRDRVLADSMLPPEMVAQAEFSRGKGCPYCGRTGYRGRIGIYELMVINGKLREMMFAGSDTKELRVEAIKNGMSTLYGDGMLKVIRGITTFEEVYRVAKQTEQEDSCRSTTWSRTSDCKPLHQDARFARPGGSAPPEPLPSRAGFAMRRPPGDYFQASRRTASRSLRSPARPASPHTSTRLLSGGTWRK